MVEKVAIRDHRPTESNDGRTVEVDDLHLDRAPNAAPSDVEAGVDGQTGGARHRTGPGRATEVPPGPEEGLLDRVSREFGVPEDEPGCRVQPRDGQVDEYGEGLMIALPRSFDEPSLVHGRLGCGTATVVVHTGYGAWPA